MKRLSILLWFNLFIIFFISAYSAPKSLAVTQDISAAKSNPQKTPTATKATDSVLLPAALRKGLMLWYGFDRDQKNMVTDKSGNGNEGKIDGGSFTEMGRIGHGYQQRGGEDHILVGRVFLSLPVTVSLWMRSDREQKEWTSFIAWNTTVPPHNGVSIQTQGDGRLKVRMGAHPDDDFVSKSRPDGDDRWHHIVAIRDSRGKVSIYIDGKLDTSAKARGDVGTGHMLFIGRTFQPARMGQHHNGGLDEVMIWNRALSGAKVKQLYKATGGK